MFDVAIIGAGVIGASIARALSKYKIDVCLIEKENDVAMGTTKANSAIIHAGYDAKPNTLKGILNARGNQMFDELCEALAVPFQRIGSYVLAFSDDELKTLDRLHAQGIENGIPHMKIVDKQTLLEQEPSINNNVKAGLYAPSAGIIGPWELTIALVENAVNNGVTLFLNHEVLAIVKENTFLIKTSKDVIQSKLVINCAGVYVDTINNMIAKPTFSIKAWKGQYFLLDKMNTPLVSHVMFQCPTEKGKGVLIVPTVHGNTLIGPDSEDDDNKEDVGTSIEQLRFIEKQGKKTIENLPMHQVITSFAGLRAKPNTNDFIINESEDVKGFYDVAGIESPGLSSAPAIADYVVDMIKKSDLVLSLDPSFNPIRENIPHFMSLNDSEKKELIKRDKAFGNIICRCEMITEGEIVAAIKRPVGATTVDGVKRRVRPGMGRCQGGFCGAKVIEILARELNVDVQTIVKDHAQSFIVTGKTKEDSYENV